MELSRKIVQLEQLSNDCNCSKQWFCDILESCGALKTKYTEYLVTRPIDCDQELLRLLTADYDTCCALLNNAFAGRLFFRRQF